MDGPKKSLTGGVRGVVLGRIVLRSGRSCVSGARHMRSAATSVLAFVLLNLLYVMRIHGSTQSDLPDRPERPSHGKTNPPRHGEGAPRRRDAPAPDAPVRAGASSFSSTTWTAIREPATTSW